MMEIVMHNCDIQIAGNEAGLKMIIFVDKESGVRVVVPMIPEAARKISAALSGTGILVPQFIPPKDIGKSNGGQS